MKLLFWMLAPIAAGAMTVTSASNSPTQAALSYIAPTPGTCTVEVSESPSYTPLVHDVDPVLFPGSNLDSRTGALVGSTARVFIVGTRQVQVAADALKYSRALQQATIHYYRITCAGPTVATGSFTTKTLPFGVTYQDTMPMTATGAYNYPATPDSRNYKIVDSQTGVLLNKVTLFSDFSVSNGYNPPWTSSGGFGAFCADTTSAQGNYHCALPAFQANGNYLYAINPATGSSSFLGIAQGLRNDLDPAAGGFFGTVGDSGETTNWAAGSPVAIYAAVNLFGRNTIARWSYTGADVPVAPSIPPATAAGTSVDMLGGQDLNDLARAFNSHIGDFDLVGTVTTAIIAGSCGVTGQLYSVTYVSGTNFVEGPSLVGSDIQINGVYYTICTVPTKTTMTIYDHYGLSPPANPSPVAYRWRLFNCSIVGAAANYGLIKCPTGAQNSMTWEGAYFFGNGIPLGTGGSTAHWQGLVNPWAQPNGSRWTGNHSWESLGETPPIDTWATSGIISEITGGGPYDVVLGTNLAAEFVGVPPAQTVDTNVTITSASLINTHNAICTDTWSAPVGWVDGYPLSYCYPHFLQSLEVGDILAFIVGGSITEFVQIKVKHSPTSYDIIRGTQNQNTTVPAHSAGLTMRMYPGGEQQQYNLSQGLNWGYIFWDFVNSPHGTENPGDYVLNWGSHPSTRLNIRTQYPFDNNASATNKSQWGVVPPYNLPVDSTFAGVTATGSGNFFQKHPALASGDVTAQFDVWYFVGGGASSIIPVTCTPTPCTHVWQTQAVGPTIAPKVMPIFSKTYGRNLVDVSSPTKVLSDADDFVFCIARTAGSCAAGSSPGEVYFSDSNLDPIGGGQCTGGENPSGLHDICVANWNALGTAAVSSKFFTNDLTGAKSMRALSRMFGNWEMNTNSSGNLKMTYPGDYALWWRFPTAPTYSPFISEVWAIKVPADPVDDGIDRGKFIPATLSLTAPSGLGVTQARVKFWYQEQGGTYANPFCTSRREGCVAVLPTVNQTVSTTCATLANVCTLTVTPLAIPGSVFSLNENPTTCADASGTPVGFTLFTTSGSNPINTVTVTYPANTNITCVAWGAPFSYQTTDTYTPAACSTTCTITLPVAPLHTAYFTAEFLDAGSSIVATKSGIAIENNVIFLGAGTSTSWQGSLISGSTIR